MRRCRQLTKNRFHSLIFLNHSFYAGYFVLHSLIALWFSWVKNWGYAGVFVLMALESTIVPVPSELVMPPAAFWAAQGHMSFWGVVAAGTLGSYFGSTISFLVFRALGAAFLKKYGRYMLLKEDKILLAERIVQKHGAVGIFVSRLLPVVRHLISMPAGIFKMNFKLFSLMTLVGSGFWCFVLAFWGQKVLGAHPELLDSPEQMMAVVRSELKWFVFAIVAFLLLYVFVMVLKNKRQETT